MLFNRLRKFKQKILDGKSFRFEKVKNSSEKRRHYLTQTHTHTQTYKVFIMGFENFKLANLRFLLNYETGKVVEIQNKKIGLWYRLIQFCVIVYIIG